MSFPSILEHDKWTVGRGRIEAEIDRRMLGLLNVNSLERLEREKGWIEALHWAIATVDPPRQALVTDDEE